MIKKKGGLLNKYILFILCVILFLLIFYFYIHEYIINKREYFENLNLPVYVFYYGNINGKDQEQLKKLYKDEYKDSINTIKVIEKDLNKIEENQKEDFLKTNNLPPKFEYEIRYYPKGLNMINNFESYYGKISELKDIITKKENSYNDLVSEEENKEADKSMKYLM